ncbi:DUF58 domain-containing protein [Planctomicrobium sp. SH664]|uniref:DUF58 domain-containing protein n=1 Tax=Planctomicrobium sp. SH664 TaxID=3448125 RepID=UPI003F5C5E4E
MKRQLSGYLRSWLLYFQFKFTPPGRVAIMVLFLTAFGVVTVEVPVYQIFCSLCGLLLCVEFVGMVMRPRLKVSGTLPERIAAGEVATGSVTIENVGFLPALDIMCGLFGLPAGLSHRDATGMLPSIPKGERRLLPVTLQGVRRGEYALPEMHVHSTFPLNLMRFGRAVVPAGKLTVVPAFHRLEQFAIPISKRYQLGTMLQDSKIGDAPEYIGNRDYVPGEALKRVDFRAWARVGKPVVREYQDEYCSRVAMVLDTHIPYRFRQFQPETFPRFEAAVSLTASIADFLDGAEAAIDVFAAGPDLYLFQTVSGITYLESVLEILAAVETSRHNPFEKLTPVIAESLESTSVVICVFLDWDDSREELTRQIVEHGCALRVFLIREQLPEKAFPSDESNTHFTPQQILQGQVRSL